MRAFLNWTSQAREELMEIYLIIAADNPSAADRWQATIEERTDLLMDNPRLGVRRNEIAPHARMLVHGAYLILYQTHPDSDHGIVDQVEIVSVVHGSRDTTQLF